MSRVGLVRVNQPTRSRSEHVALRDSALALMRQVVAHEGRAPEASPRAGFARVVEVDGSLRTGTSRQVQPAVRLQGRHGSGARDSDQP